MKTKLLLVWFVVLFIFIQPAYSQNLPIIKDEGAADVSFVSFREKLISAINKKDKKFLLSVIDTNIYNTPGAGDGKEEFIIMWGLNEKNSEIWKELATVFSLGTLRKGSSTYWAPYLIKYAGQANTIVIKDNVSLYQNPNINSKTIADISFKFVINLCEFYENACDSTWAKVRTEDGKIGFAKHKNLRRPGQYRLKMKKKNGKWMITEFSEDF